MNRMPGSCLTTAAPSFTDKQGQYLAFIHAYGPLHSLLVGPPAIAPSRAADTRPPKRGN